MSCETQVDNVGCTITLRAPEDNPVSAYVKTQVLLPHYRFMLVGSSEREYEGLIS